MSHTDGYNAEGAASGGNPFAQRSYSDQFVRSATQPLSRKGTRPLADSAALEAQLTAADEQIQLCRTILERFAPRIRLLRAAHEANAKSQAPVARPPLKKPLGKPAPVKKPAAQSAPLSASEKVMVDKLARRLASKPDLVRRSAIALTQFDNASQAVAEAVQRLDQARYLDPVSVVQILAELEISKVQGRVYPICNFYEVFKDDDLVGQLFPPPARPPTAGMGKMFG